MYFLQILISVLLDIQPEAGLQDHRVILFFNFLRSLHTVFHSGCTILHSYQQCIRVSISPHPHQYVFCLFCFKNRHSNRCEVISRCGFICISLMISDVDHLFLYLLVICTSSLKKCLYKSFAHFLMTFIFAIELQEFLT